MEHGDACLEKLVFIFLFSSQRAGQEGADLSRACRSCFQLRKVILSLSILAKPDGSPGPPAPPAPDTHAMHLDHHSTYLQITPFSAWFSSNCLPSPVM